MLANNFFILLGIICCLHQLNVNAYPTINIRRLFDSAIEGRYKKGDVNFPQSDEDVLELEHLKHDESTDDSEEGGDIHFEVPSAIHSIPHSAPPAIETLVNPTDLLPNLEQQLEEVTTARTSPINNVGQREEEEISAVIPHHRPPMLPQHDGGKVPNSQHQPLSNLELNVGNENSANPPMMTKPFYGAARLAFGQNPEVLPSTTSTTSTSTSSTSTTLTSSANEKSSESIITTSPSVPSVETSAILPPADNNQDQVNPSSTTGNSEDNSNSSLSPPINPNEMEHIGDSIIPQLEVTKPGPERRSITMMPPKTAENLLKHKDGQYSSFDMAQYVFWTGDEAGVARAVEEFIEQGLMSRENAIKFLRDIRLGIEYLQSSYANRVFPDQLRDNYVKKHSHNSYPMLTPTLATTTTTTTTRKPIPPTTTERIMHMPREYAVDPLVLNQHLDRTLENVPSLSRLQDISNTDYRENADYSYDEAAGRAKIAKFLYTEFSLEEVIYQMAKVMFSQSLSQGSHQAQQALQRLTDFLEIEGKHGMISPELQKKVLDVLLSALSDTLVEHPELLAAARANLGSSFEKIPMRSMESIKN